MSKAKTVTTSSGLVLPIKKASGDMRKRQVMLICYLIPFMVWLAIFAYVPIFGWSYAFINYVPGKPVLEHEFIGFENFRLIFVGGISDFWKVMRNTMVISGLSLLCTPLPIVFAIMLSQVKWSKFAKPVQTISSVPNFISWVLIYAVMLIFLSQEDGMINRTLVAMGLMDPLSKPAYLSDPDIAWYLQTAISVWKTIGWNAIIYLAGIAGIDQELYDAADVDGANRWQKIMHVTVPGIIPTYIVLLLMAIANILSNGFEQYWLFGNGLTIDKLEVFDTYVFRLGIRQMQFSFSTAMGIFKSIVSVTLISIANVISRMLRGNSIF